MQRIDMKRILPSVILLLCSFLTVNAQTQSGPLLKPTRQEGSVKLQADATVIRSQNVIVNVQQLRAANNSRLALPLLDGRTLTLVRDRQEQMRQKGLIWYGKIADEPRSSVILSLVGDVLIGNIMTQSGKIYQIRYLGNKVHSLREIDQSKFPRESQPLKPDLKPMGAMSEDTCSTDPPTDIDVLVVYTDDARAAAGGTDAMDASVFLAVAETNQSYVNSNVTQRIRLVHVEEVNYAETGNMGTDLTRLQNGSDGILDNVPILRNTFAADAVSMIVNNGGSSCGIAFMMQSVSNAFESAAYSVVARNCATGYYSFGHELGHNMGTDHDCPNANSTGPYPYNRGYSDTSPTSPATPWRTIMAYPTSPSSTRVPYWSNPAVNYPIGGDPMGGTCNGNPTDNHLVLNNTALTVANFRCSSPGVPNVWMKDTWNDTGVEPNPSTEEMWKSPYIWVRNTQDTNLVHQHEHQNPEFGSTNWVYVKLHNGGNAATSGNLELWYANASATLTWQGAWTQLASIPVNSFAAHSTKVVEAQWSNLPGTGHYCIIARWNSASDPMATTETADINSNTLNNNNIVWRNLNIVNLTPDASEEANFIIRGMGRERMATNLIIRPPREELENSFIRHGQVSVRLDDAMMNAWKEGGGKGRGFRAEGRTFLITDPAGAVFDNIIITPQLAGYVTLRFKRLPTTPRRAFVIDAIQTRSQGQPGKAATQYMLGGVSYEIHTDRSDPGNSQATSKKTETEPERIEQVTRAGWRVEVGEGKTVRSTLTINNRCSAPHLFRIKSSAKYLRFEQPADSVLAQPNSNTRLVVRFDAAGLKSKTYRSKVVVECLDCKKEPGCSQSRDEVPIEMTVTQAATPNERNPARP